MADFDRIKDRGERLRQRMNDAISPDRAWDSLHARNSPPKRYPNPNFRTNPDVNDPRNFDDGRADGLADDDDDFYEYLSDEEEKRDPKRTDGKPSGQKQHDIEEEYKRRIQELDKQKKLDELRDKINQDAHHNLLVHQINQTRTVDPFAKQPDPPMVLQLYLRIFGAMYLNPRELALVGDTSDKKLSDLNLFRNTFVQYKDFPKGNIQRTNIIWNSNNPVFNYKAYFPIIVRSDIFDLLSKFYFLFEVWDQVTADKHNLVGITKFPLH